MKTHLFKLGKVSKQKLIGWINPSGLASWGQPGSKIQPKKYCFEEEKIQR